MTDALPDHVRDLSPATRWVYKELRLSDTPLTVTDLVTRTGYSKRGIRSATETLLDEQLIEEEYEAGDARRKQFDTR